MAEYIEREALLEKVQFRLPGKSKYAHVIARCVEITRELITEAPAADVVPKVNDAEGGREGGLGHVVHGRWIEKDWGYECSACECCEDIPRNYCPNCGAKMDAEVRKTD